MRFLNSWMGVIVECLLVNMQIIFLGTNLSHLLSTRCLSSGRRWCGKSSTSSCCDDAPPGPSRCWRFFHGCFHIPHALWVKKSPHHFCFLAGTELSKVHEGRSTIAPTWAVEGLLATLSVRLLRALDCSTHTRTNAVFCFKELFPYECGKCKICSMNRIFPVCVFTYIHSLTHLQTLGGGLFHCSFIINYKLFISERNVNQTASPCFRVRREEFPSFFNGGAGTANVKLGFSLEAWKCQKKQKFCVVGICLPSTGSLPIECRVSLWKSETVARMWSTSLELCPGHLKHRPPVLELM